MALALAARRALTTLSVAAMAAGSIAGISMGVAGAAPAATTGGVYVAMGDSFSAGAGISPLVGANAAPAACLRSKVDYPSLVAAATNPSVFRDVTCSSATTKNFAGTQGAAPAQYNALTADTTLVTVGIGGNDVNLVGLATGCINFLVQPFGTSCAAQNTAGGTDKYGALITAFTPTYGAVIDEIHKRAPLAKILMVGYPTGLRPGACPKIQPVWSQDGDYLEAKIEQLNSVMSAQSAAHGATYVDLATSTRTHDACAGKDAWIVGVIPTSTDAFVPFHPNALGHVNAAKQIQLALAQ